MELHKTLLCALVLCLGCGSSSKCVDRVANFLPTELRVSGDSSGLLVSGTTLASYCGDDPGPQPLVVMVNFSDFSVCRAAHGMPSDAEPVANPLSPEATKCGCTLAFSEGTHTRFYVYKTPDQQAKELAVYDVSNTQPQLKIEQSFFGIKDCP